jgi:hypothetical protein
MPRRMFALISSLLSSSQRSCSSSSLRVQQAEQHFLDATGAGGLELLLDSGLQGCVVDFDGQGSLLGLKVTGEGYRESTESQEDGAVESHVSQRTPDRRRFLAK